MAKLEFESGKYAGVVVNVDALAGYIPGFEEQSWNYTGDYPRVEIDFSMKPGVEAGNKIVELQIELSKSDAAMMAEDPKLRIGAEGKQLVYTLKDDNADPYALGDKVAGVLNEIKGETKERGPEMFGDSLEMPQARVQGAFKDDLIFKGGAFAGVVVSFERRNTVEYPSVTLQFKVLPGFAAKDKIAMLQGALARAAEESGEKYVGVVSGGKAMMYTLSSGAVAYVAEDKIEDVLRGLGAKSKGGNVVTLDSFAQTVEMPVPVGEVVSMSSHPEFALRYVEQQKERAQQVLAARRE